ncbi:hypothetical protein ACQP1P_25355 [Dactylosporangium sp. CA-052675]|uniref:hypothetical protein n=1 Tax=Dactylosporangium sp. CA-052675 TaxID=3239927 RepID=UPI003D906DF5
MTRRLAALLLALAALRRPDELGAGCSPSGSRIRACSLASVARRVRPGVRLLAALPAAAVTGVYAASCIVVGCMPPLIPAATPPAGAPFAPVAGRGTARTT